MAAKVLTPDYFATREGVELAETQNDDGNGLYIEGNDGNVLLVVSNSSGADIDFIVSTTANLAGEPLANKTVTVPAGKTIVAGPWPPVLFNSTTDTVAVTDSTSSLHFYAIRL